MITPTIRPATVISLLTILLLSFVHLWHGQNRIADPDEFQYLVNAFNAADGLRPYVHYWDNHGPLNIWLLQPILQMWQGGHSLIHWLRILPWLNTLAICTVLAIFLRRCYPERPVAPFLAVLFLLATPPYLLKSLEIRGDNLANLFATIAFTTLLVGIREKKTWLFFAAGLSLGLIAGITLKFLTIGFGLAIIAGGAYLKIKTIPRIRDISAAIIGFTLPVAGVVGCLYGLHLLEPFILCYYDANTTRQSSAIESGELVDIFSKATVWGLMVLIVLGSTGWRIIKRSADEIETAMFVLVMFTVGQFIFLLPTKNMQSLLPAFPPLAILGGLAGNRLMHYTRGYSAAKRRIAMSATALLAAGLFVGLWNYCKLGNQQLPKQIAFADQVLKATKGDRYIFDPSGVVFLKPKPEPFPVLVTFIRDLYKSGEIGSIKDDLTAFNINAVVYDKRTEDLPDADMDYIRQNYTTVLEGPSCLLVQRSPTIPLKKPLRTDSEIVRWWINGRSKKENQATPVHDAAWFTEYMRYFEKNKRWMY